MSVSRTLKHTFSRGADVKKGPSWQRWEATSSRKSRWPGQATAKLVIREGNRDQLWRARWAGGHESGPRGGQGKDGTYGATMPLSHFYPDPPDWLRCAPHDVKSAALSLPLSIPRQ